MISYETILAIVERRFDYASARVVLGEAMKTAGLAANKKVFTSEEIRSLSDAITLVGSRVEPVTSALNDLATTAATSNEQRTADEASPALEPEMPVAETPTEEPSHAELAPKKKKK